MGSLEKQISIKDREIQKMKNQIQEFEDQKLDFIHSQDKLDKLYQLGIIDSAGDYIPYKPDGRENEMS